MNVLKSQKIRNSRPGAGTSESGKPNYDSASVAQKGKKINGNIERFNRATVWAAGCIGTSRI